MQKIRSMDEYKNLIRETLYDLDDLRASIEYDEEFMGDAQELIEPLTQQLNALLASIKDGKYEFSNIDLPFMNIVNRVEVNLLPFKQMFILINTTHKSGLDTE